MFTIIHGLSPAYLRGDILLNDNSNHQTRSVTSLSCQIPKNVYFLIPKYLEQDMEAV